MYWPKEGTEVYGVISVTMVKEDIMATYTIRTFTIRHLRVSFRKIILFFLGDVWFLTYICISD